MLLTKEQFDVLEILAESPQSFSEMELERMNQIMTPLLEKYIVNNVENRNLQSLIDTLLPKLMNGEIDLENIDI